jgi:hypothetical protein
LNEKRKHPAPMLKVALITLALMTALSMVIVPIFSSVQVS